MANKTKKNMAAQAQERDGSKLVIYPYLDTKTLDWRFQKYFELSCSTNRTSSKPYRAETIYWVGTVELKKINRSSKNFKVSFMSNRLGEITDDVDAYREREVDGKECGTPFVPYMYYIDDPQLLEAFMDAKEKGENFLHFFLEEEVDEHGNHYVDILYSPENEKPILGKSTKKRIKDIPYSQLNWFLRSYSISDKTKRLRILEHDRYDWKK